MGKLKKILSCAIILCIGSICFVACGNYGNSGNCGDEGYDGDNLKWKLDDDGTLTISGTGKMANNGIGHSSKWLGKKESVKKVVIEDGVTSIGECAFYECSNMTEVIIPDSVTTIGFEAFSCCSSLKEIDIPDNVTTIEWDAFYRCKSLTEIVIPDSLQTIERSVFSGCESLTEINIPDSVESIKEFAFSSCKNLKKVTIPETLKECEKGAFGNTEFFKDNTRNNQPLIINDIVVDGSGCTDEVIIPEGVMEIGKEAFAGTEYYDHESIHSIVLPDSIRTIRENAFVYCKDLEDINLPEGLETIEQGAFKGCNDLMGIMVLPKSLKNFSSCLPINVTGLLVQNSELDISVVSDKNVGIYADSGSKAQEYAEENGLEFESLDDSNFWDIFILDDKGRLDFRM